MAVQQRIIGGGLLLAGIAVVLILIFLFTNKGVPWDEAYGQFKTDIQPRYRKAEESGDYLEIQKIAEDAMKLEKSTAMPSVMLEVKADAAKGDAQAQALLKLIESDAFKKNAQGLYALDGEWHDSRTHSVLRLLKRSLADGTTAVLDARRAAKGATAVLADLRLGSGLEIPLPAVGAGSNPVAAADAGLFAVFALPAADARKALAAKGASAKANSTRLVWNQADATGTRARLAQDLSKVPTLADTIERAGVALGKSEQDVKGLDAAKPRASEYVRSAALQLASVLAGPEKEAFEKDATIGTIADALMQEAKLLKGVASNAPGLGQALAGSFAP
jgi:hypothetical protein